jgi:hypothetical protein
MESGYNKDETAEIIFLRITHEKPVWRDNFQESRVQKEVTITLDNACTVKS